MPHAAESGDEDSVGGEIASDYEREVSGAVADSSLGVGDGCSRGLECYSMRSFSSRFITVSGPMRTAITPRAGSMSRVD